MGNFNSIYLFYIFIGLSAVMFAEGMYLLVYSNASYRKKINRRLKVMSDKPDRESVLVQLRRERGLTSGGDYRYEELGRPSVRAPRVSHAVPVTSKSSGQGLVPMPKLMRSPLRTASDVMLFATNTGARIGSLTTNVAKRRRVVTAHNAPINTNGSMNGLSSRNSRVPSAV